MKKLMFPILALLILFVTSCEKEEESSENTTQRSLQSEYHNTGDFVKGPIQIYTVDGDKTGLVSPPSWSLLLDYHDMFSAEDTLLFYSDNKMAIKTAQYSGETKANMDKFRTSVGFEFNGDTISLKSPWEGIIFLGDIDSSSLYQLYYPYVHKNTGLTTTSSTTHPDTLIANLGAGDTLLFQEVKKEFEKP